MADKIKVNVNELYDQLNQIKNDGMDYIELIILDEEKIDDDIIPRTLTLIASKENDTLEVEYDMIEEI